MSSFSSFHEFRIPLPSIWTDQQCGQSLSHSVKRCILLTALFSPWSICKEVWNAAAHSNNVVKLTEALNWISWWMTPFSETSLLPSPAELPGLPSQLNIIEVHSVARRPAALTSHFWQIHLQRSQHISIKSNKYSKAGEASQDGQTLLPQFLQCYANLGAAVILLWWLNCLQGKSF